MQLRMNFDWFSFLAVKDPLALLEVVICRLYEPLVLLERHEIDINASTSALSL